MVNTILLSKRGVLTTPLHSTTKKKDGDYGTMHRLLKVLSWRYATPTELAEILQVTRQTIHYHLRRLKEWGFVVKSTRECILATCIDENRTECILEDGTIKTLSCQNMGGGRYYVYSSSYYVRKLFPSRPAPSLWSPPSLFIDIVRKRLNSIGVLCEVKGYDFLLMTAILTLMAAVLWNPAPRGDSYWVRLKHLTARGIKENIPKFLEWYVNTKAVKDIKKEKIGNPVEKRGLRHDLLEKYSKKYEPSVKKVRWILARMYDYLMVERLGGDRCPYGVWVPHPSLFSPDNRPDFHLPRHHHIRAKHRFKSLGVKQSFTWTCPPDNQVHGFHA